MQVNKIKSNISFGSVQNAVGTIVKENTIKEKPLKGASAWIYDKFSTQKEVSKITEKIFKFCDTHISSPEQRAAIGVTGLFLQPTIDYLNPDIDDDTRDISVIKTISKVIIGALSGVVIRALFIALSKKYTNVAKVKHPFGMYKKAPDSSFLLPNEKSCQTLSETQLDKYRKAMGTLIATLVMTITNFVIDAPLTNLLTNFLRDSYDTYQINQEELKKKTQEFMSSKQSNKKIAGGVE